MSETLNDIKKYEVEELFGHNMAKVIYKEIMDSRKCVSDDEFTYDTIEKSIGDKTYVIETRHVKIDESMSHAKSSCNKCYCIN